MGELIMNLAYRLSMMLISLTVILMIGWLSFGNFNFATGQFWFVAGALLLIMLSLVDQPHFSKDANVFVNGVTALISLFIIGEANRTGIWFIFFLWAMFLIVASFTLMALRSRELFLETKEIQLFSRINRTIGRPEAIFSAYFLWGVFIQFSLPKDNMTINALFLFWAVFMILNIPSIAQTISEYFSSKKEEVFVAGVITGILSPRLAIAKLSPSLPSDIVGKKVILKLENGNNVAEGALFEDSIVKGLRQGRIALATFSSNWSEVSAGGKVIIEITNQPNQTKIVGVVAAGSSIGWLIFEVDPKIPLHAGQVVKVRVNSTETFYQIVSAKIDQISLEDKNGSQNVRVVAGQLGYWEARKATFSPIDWVASAGELVSLENEGSDLRAIPNERCLIGHVPNSTFPVHVNISDSITHNTALIGVTGSGKSYLAFHLIEAYINAGIKVLILDMTRQHWQFLQHLNPTPIAAVGNLQGWLTGTSNLAIHQFANAGNGFPAATADFVEGCFNWLQGNTQLQAGVDIPSRLCIVFEEAHSLIPEWNQVAQQSDTQCVNRTARVILQGRKFGLGSLLITQRTANVTKTILNQCNTICALRSFDQTGLDFLRNYMGEEYSQAISTLPDRTAILVGKASSSTRPVIMKIANFGNRWNVAQPAAN